MGSVKQDTLRGSKWAAIEKFSSQGMQFVIGIILARILSPSDFGVVGMLAIFIAISQTFIDSGFSNALIRKIDRTEEDYSTAFYFNIIVGIVCYGVLWLLSPWVADFFNTPILSDLLKVLAIAIFFNSLTVVQIARFTVDVNFKAQAIATFISVLLSGCLGVLMAYRGWGVWSLAWQQVSAAIIKTIVIWIQARWIPRERFSYSSFKGLFSFGSKLLAAGLLSAVYSQIASILIGKFYTPKELGIYTRGQQFAQVPTSAVAGILARVTFPILSNYQNDNDRLIQIYRKYIRVTSLLIFFALMLLCALAHPLVILLIGEKWEPCVIILQILCFNFMTEHISILNLQLLQIKGRSDLFLNLEVIKRIISLSFLIFAVQFGIVAVSIAIVIYAYIGIFINTYYNGKLFNFGLSKQIKEIHSYYIFSVVSCAPVYFLTYSSLNHILQIIIGFIFASFLYGFLLRKDSIMLELVSTIKNKIHINETFT